MLGAKRLVIVADGPLYFVPFAALPTPGVNGTSGQPLVTAHEVVNLPSASVLAYLRKSPAWNSEVHRNIAILADPVFDRNDPRVHLSTTTTSAIDSPRPNAPLIVDQSLERSLEAFPNSDRGHDLPRLLFSRMEADEILSLVPSGTTKWVDFDANLMTVFGSQLSQYRIVHFATHGLFNPTNPLLSGLCI